MHPVIFLSASNSIRRNILSRPKWRGYEGNGNYQLKTIPAPHADKGVLLFVSPVPCLVSRVTPSGWRLAGLDFFGTPGLTPINRERAPINRERAPIPDFSSSGFAMN